MPVSSWRLDDVSADELRATLAPLFEDAPRFIARVVAARPFGSWGSLFERAEAIARAMPEDEQVELIDAHPRIGAPPGSVSALSYREQGYDQELAEASAEAERARLRRDLDRLNAAYEERFGFRFVVFVAGRPRAAIVPLMEAALGADRASELERALRDVVAIARDRAGRTGLLANGGGA